MNELHDFHPLSLEEKVALVAAGLLLMGLGMFLGAWSSLAQAQIVPTFSVSKSVAPYGTAVTLSFTAGSFGFAPGGCIVYITDATRDRYAPWGLMQSLTTSVVITSDTTFSIVCLGPTGGYVYPSPSTLSVKLERPHTLTPSSTSVKPGETLTLSWDGGSSASTCAVSLTDATRTNYYPWTNAPAASVQATLYSTATFNMTCVDNVTGAYILPHRSVTVTVSSPTSCSAGQTLYNGQCYANTRDCAVSNGSGVQTFANGSYGSCAVASCNTGFTINSASNACQVESPRACNVGNGSGTQTWNGSSWGTCQIHTCTPGYTLYNNTCYGAHAPKLSLSSSKVTSGDQVLVVWDGGTYASTCAVYITDATRNKALFRTALTGAVTQTISSNTTFNMTCISKVGGAYLEPQSVVGVTVENSTSSAVQSAIRQLAALNLSRGLSWAEVSGLWEIVWEGEGSTPGNGAATSHAWSAPFDDDWNEPRVAASSFAFDAPTPGFLTIDRTDPLDIHKGGVIVRHDEFLSFSTGLTFEFRAKVHPNSAENAFNFVYSTGPGDVSHGSTDPTFELLFSPGKIVAGGYNEDRLNTAPPTVAFNTTDFHTYRFVQEPGSIRFALYVDDNTTPLIRAEGNFYKPSFFTDQDTPYVMLGGEAGNRPVHVTIDYVHYRRGAFPPGASFTTPSMRNAPPLPPNLSAGATFTTILDGTKSPQAAGYTQFGSASAWRAVGDGTLEFNSLISNDHSQLILDPPPGLTDNKGSYTFELRAKVLSDSKDRGFSLDLLNGKTGLTMTLSPGKVETFMGLKPAGYQTHLMDTTDGFHTYRLVHPARSMYGYLYIDDNPVPSIVDQHGSADTWVDHPLLELGSVHYADRTNWASLRGHVLIDYLRVSPTAYAPVLPGPSL